jgi:dTDP-4-amino-4,6-dideoxygalactose transaminase
VSTTPPEGVPFLDLRRRIAAIKPRLEAEVGRVFARGRFILGESAVELEHRFAKYCQVDHAVAVASGTDALWLALEALDVGAGDEVITVSNTCAPTVSAIVKTGATPVLVEVEPGTLTMDPERAEAAITPRTKCLLPVHLYGQCADLGALRELAERRGLALVEDCAQAHGAEHDGRRAGSVGRAGCFSFYPTKNLGALGDGGMVVTHEGALAQRLRLMRNYGYAEANRSVVRGFNSRLDEVQAAVLLAGLDRLDDWNDRRRSIAARYTRAFAGSAVVPPVEAPRARHVYHLYVVRSRERERLREALRGSGIETMIHYPVPVHLQEGYAGLVKIGPGGLALTERLAGEILSLPLYPELTDREADRVIEVVTAWSGPRG